jgi:hypothetical protein
LLFLLNQTYGWVQKQKRQVPFSFFRVGKEIPFNRFNTAGFFYITISGIKWNDGEQPLFSAEFRIKRRSQASPRDFFGMRTINLIN